MFYILSMISYIVYILLVSTLFITSIMSSISSSNFIIALLKLLVMFFLFYEIYVEWKYYLNAKKKNLIQRKIHRRDFYFFISAFFATLLTYLINHNFSLGPVIASSLVGLIAGLLVPQFAVPIYCGSFAGMVNSLLVTDFNSIIVVGIFTGFLYVTGHETFKGFGGKLGATAYFATLLSSMVFGTFSETMTGGPVSLRYDIYIAFIIGSLGTYLINSYCKIDPVVSSSLLGLTFGLILPNIFSNGNALAVALFCGTFIGMSTRTKLSTGKSVLLASTIGTVIYLYTSPYFAGLGGKLGLIAFGASIATAGFYNLKNHLHN